VKKAQDRASVIEEALGSFEWLSQVGVWCAFALAGLSFLFWARLHVSGRILASFAFLSVATFPLRNLKLGVHSLRTFTAICAILLHALVLQNEYEKIPSVLLIIPSFLFVEIIQGWVWKLLFTCALWSIHVYWSFGMIRSEWPTMGEMASSIIGATVTLFLVFMFNGIHSVGKKLASGKLEKLKGKVDFKGQRVHASRLQILGELSASLVHELSTPVTNLQGFFMQLMESEDFRMNIKAREVMNRVEANLARLRDLLLGFRSFSKMQPTENNTFKSSDLFRDLELLSRHSFQSQQVELQIMITSAEIELSGNRVEIGQVMMNFILNALSSAKAGPNKKVLVGSEKNDEGYVLYVEDTGKGVPLDMREKIFRPFFSTKGDEGSGLGLYISKIIADHHECKINVTTAQVLGGKGARFELHFPEARIVIPKDLSRVA
jgi:signal transduction histidine kinase